LDKETLSTIGDDMFFTKGALSPRRYGWYWSF